MHAIRQLRDNLRGRSTPATLDELMARGRNTIRVLKPEDIESLIQEGVEKAAGEQLEELRAQVREQQEEIERLRGDGDGEARPMDSAMMTRVLRELSSLKQSVERSGAGAQLAPDALESALGEKLDVIANSLGAKLDRLRGKSGGGGFSSVDEPKANLDGLFAKELDTELETNLEDVGVKNKDGRGIGSNLERIKKLRGGK